MAKKKSEFIIRPFNPGKFESNWKIFIPSLSFEQLFRIKFNIKEPRVYFDQTMIQLDSTLVGRAVTGNLTLTNDENILYEVTIKNIITSEVSLTASPEIALIRPNSKLFVSLTFIPKKEKVFNLFLNSVVKNKVKPLRVNIKGEGCYPHSKLRIHYYDNQKTLDNLTRMTNLDFGEIKSGDSKKIIMFLVNSGKIDLKYRWFFENEKDNKSKSKMSLPNYLFIKSETGIIKVGEEHECSAIFRPIQSIDLDGCKLSCRISQVQKYELNIIK